MKMKNIIAENMKRFRTKNLSESDYKRIEEQDQAKTQNIDALVKKATALAAKLIMITDYSDKRSLAKNYGFTWDDATGILAYEDMRSVGSNKETKSKFSRRSNYSRLPRDVKFSESHRAVLQKKLSIALQRSGLLDALSMTEGSEITEQEQKKEFSLYSSTGKFIRQSRNGMLGKISREEMEQAVGKSIEKHPNGYKYKQGYPKK